MVSTFVNPVVNPSARLGVSAFDAIAPVRLWQNASESDLDIVIRAVYRQVLGNAYVMESERLTVPESQFQRGELSVREFVRQVAKSELYRSRFFHNCYRYRAIELNFKHLLGRAPDTFEEMRCHSAYLDQGGHDAEVDSYLDSDEYQTIFGEDIVPYYRGYKTQVGQSLLEFTNMLQLLPSASSSDKNLTTNNRPLLTRSLIASSTAARPATTTDVNRLLTELFKPKFSAVFAAPTPFVAPPPLVNEHDLQIAALQKELAALQTEAAIGGAIVRSGASESARVVITSSFQAVTPAAELAALQAELAEARALASVADYRLNKWRSRTFSR